MALREEMAKQTKSNFQDWWKSLHATSSTQTKKQTQKGLKKADFLFRRPHRAEP